MARTDFCIFLVNALIVMVYYLFTEAQHVTREDIYEEYDSYTGKLPDESKVLVDV